MSKFPGLHFDLGKKARDLLYKDYATRPPTYFRYQYVKWNFDLSCESPEIFPGLTTLFRFTIPDSAKVELRFLQENSGITAGVGVKAHEQGSFNGTVYNPVVNLSSVIGSTSFSVRTGFAFDVSTRTFDDISAGLSFNSNFFITSLNLDDKLESLKAYFYHEFDPLTRTAIAAELKQVLSTNATTLLTIGGQYALFPFSLIKARINSEAKVSAFIQFQLWQKLLLGISGEVDFRATNKMSKLGISIAASP
ncbi:hypothetical protein K2173_027042 [Erythroxylum novogranatense]|uniref:Uncharacterized protein n=1 Tax=Erythroxylum novogranatense TaxID=1862640 RepID=A0AAV8TY09_9ROSI|nr:hypothetical protein K2173_027042 [Erythroxylum novogranatense]